MNDYRILASSGTFVGRANGCDYTKMAELKDEIRCDGFEFLMMSPWYGEEDKIVSLMKENEVLFPTFHTDKNIGVYMEQGKKEDALKTLHSNLSLAKRVGSEKVVVHLWSGSLDETNKTDILKTATEMVHMGEDFGITVTIENIPSLLYSPLSLWEEMLGYNPDIKLTFDTRFATYFGEYMDIFANPCWKNVEHIHISAFNKNVDRTARIIRPILHPGEGIPDFDHLFSNMPKYRGTVTLESPVLAEDGTINKEKLNKSLDYLRGKLELYKKV